MQKMKKIFWSISILLIISFPLIIKAQIKNNCAPLQNILNMDVIEVSNGICKTEYIREHIEISHLGQYLSPITMDLSFRFTFEKVNNVSVVVGEMALLEDELQNVIDELKNGNINITAIHNHIIHEQPKILHIHFQGTGDGESLASTIKNAIEKTS